MYLMVGCQPPRGSLSLCNYCSLTHAIVGRPIPFVPTKVTVGEFGSSYDVIAVATIRAFVYFCGFMSMSGF